MRSSSVAPCLLLPLLLVACKGGGHAPPAPPTGLTYATSPAIYVVGVAITPNAPTNGGGAVASYDVSPALPAGLSLSTTTGIISGTPTTVTAAASYTVTATNGGGSTTADLSVTVDPAPTPPTNLVYATNPAVYPVGVPIAANAPSSGGGAVTRYDVSPALPSGLRLSPLTGVISGIPAAVTAAASYLVTASNDDGSTQVTLSITVNDAPPGNLAYTTNPAIYTQGAAIAANLPRTNGGAPTSYGVSPALPAGLSLSPTTGVISGTPTDATATASFTVTATNGLGSAMASLTLTVVSSGTANGGGLDPAFGGGNGFVTHDGAAGGHGTDIGNAVARDGSGRLLVAGYSAEGGANGQLDMALWRYRADGTLDPTFNGKGFLTDPGVSWNGNAQTIGMGVALDSLGRIVVAGYSLTDVVGGVWMMVVWRYHPDGTRDTTFNGVGFANYPLGQMQSAGTGVAVDSSDRIVICGFAWNGTSWDAAVARYGTDGTLDTSFNGSGYAVHNGAAGGNGEDIANGVALDGSGRIVLTGGSANSAGNTTLAIWRYAPDGTLDTTFNGTGFVTRDHDGGAHGNDSGHTLTFDATGRIVVTGWSPNLAGDDDFALWRYHADGTIDTSFNGVGFLTQDGAAGGSALDDGFGVVVDASGRIVATGTSTNAAGDRDMVVWRYDSSGAPDATFGGKGFVVYAGTAGGTGGRDGGRAVLLDGAGELVVAGYSGNAAGDADLTIWRLLP
jgi:uncharacterized delta-60 repeat protein